MILSDTQIRHYLRQGWLDIEPYNDNCIQPNSYDIHLHSQILVPTVWITNEAMGRIVEVDEDNSWMWAKHNLSDLPLVLMPGGIALGRSIEHFRLLKLAGRLEGCSSLGRIFLRVHVTAGFFDYGFEGTATIEIKNDGKYPIRLRDKMRIGQMAFEVVDGTVSKPYRGRYYKQVDPTPARTADTRFE